MIRNGSTVSLKTVVVLGAPTVVCTALHPTVKNLGYSTGARTAQLIAAGLPDGWRIVLIPFVLSSDGSKGNSIAWLRGKQRAIGATNSVVVVGGGALGIRGYFNPAVQFATNIASVYPGKPVTLSHSRTRLLPRFDSEMHAEILQAMESANINAILGERLESLDLVSSTSGHSTLLCTGQRPNTELLQSLDSRTVNTNTALAQVLRTMQLALVPPPLPPSPITPALLPACASANEEDVLADALAQIALQNESVSSAASEPAADAEEAEEEEEEELSPPYPHIFTIGDAANAFGAIPAGHNAYYQAEVAARNVLRLVHGKTDEPLERYTPGPPAIKVLLGLKKNVYQVNGVVGVGKETQDDLNAAAIWGYFGSPVVEEPEMFR
ncbi:hypothetical protein R3P38DRAFT_3212336 [Favolaschia claudopus]|uniref:FAD/NAD(P)-binding domain-containing protein n=1 Tax=Favolaschia claudopus TaxID=2862362 RepID=A0AAW0AEZ7_9AGAR